MCSLLIQEHGSGISRLRSDVETKRLNMLRIPVVEHITMLRPGTSGFLEDWYGLERWWYELMAVEKVDLPMLSER